MGNKHFINLASTIFLVLALASCSPSEKQLKAEAERKAKEIEQAQLDVLQSKVRNSAKDPISTQFQKMKLVHNNTELCGEINAKNSYGGYVGFKPFAVTVDGSVIVLQKISMEDARMLSKLNAEERKLLNLKNTVIILKLEGQSGAKEYITDYLMMEKFAYWSEC